MQTGLQLAFGFVVPAMLPGIAGAQSYTTDLENIEISTDLVAPVVAREDTITDPAQPRPDAGIVDTAIATEPEAPETGTREQGNIFTDVSTAESASPASDPDPAGSVAEPVETRPDPGADEVVLAMEEETARADTQEQGNIVTDVSTTQSADPAAGESEATREETVVSAEQPERKDSSIFSEIETGDPRPAQQEAIDEDAIIAEWAAAWSNNDVEAYLDYYADDFVPADPAMDRKSWEQLRRRRLQNKNIHIIVSNAEQHRAGPKQVEVRFTQRYTSASYRDRIIKAIEMKHTDHGWKFISERTVEELPFK